MVQYHKFVRTKSSGSVGMRRLARDKRKAHYGGFFAKPRLAKEKELRKAFRVAGGRVKVSADASLFASVATKTGVKKAKITNVVQSPANRHYARENLLTKGSIIETELGQARITSRPGQHGVVNAVLVEKKA